MPRKKLYKFTYYPFIWFEKEKGWLYILYNRKSIHEIETEKVIIDIGYSLYNYL
jgi:hypothetical protein